MRNATNGLLDEIREVKGLTSDYAVAKLLGVRTQTVTNYRSGRTQMSEEIALRAARALGRHPASLFAQIAAERTKSAEAARAWKDAARILARAK